MRHTKSQYLAKKRSLKLSKKSQNLIKKSQSHTGKSQNLPKESQSLTKRSQSLTKKSQNVTKRSQTISKKSKLFAEKTIPDLEDEMLLLDSEVPDPFSSESEEDSPVINLEDILQDVDDTENESVLMDLSNIQHDPVHAIPYVLPNDYGVPYTNPVNSEDPNNFVYMNEIDENLLRAADQLYEYSSDWTDIIPSQLTEGVEINKNSNIQLPQEHNLVVASAPVKTPTISRRCCYSDSEGSEDTNEVKWDGIPSIYDSKNALVDDLLQRRLIDDEFKELLLLGFSQMKLDILIELKTPDEKPHSYELLTFAFLLYHKKRQAYHYLQNVFKSQWPKPYQLREWRKLINKNIKKRRSCQQSKKNIQSGTNVGFVAKT